MKTNTATALRLVYVPAVTVSTMLSGEASAMMSSTAQLRSDARADMLSGAKTCMMSSTADL